MVKTTTNKPRLYIGLYARIGRSRMTGGKATYHWALLTGPKNDKNGHADGRQFHAKNGIRVKDHQPEEIWFFEQKPLDRSNSNSLLARVLIAKITNMDRLITILEGVPVTPEVQGWSCISWVIDALERLYADEEALGTRNSFAWDILKERSMSFAKRVVEIRSASETRSNATGLLDLLDGGEWIV